MDNPIRYSDLVKADNSITDLIKQLEDLVAEYDKAKAKIQGSAKEAAEGLRNVSSATEEQRESIRTVSVEAEKLAKEYRNLNDAEFKARREVLEMKKALKEQTDIDKLVIQINKNKEGSYNRLSAQYRLLKIRINELDEAQRKSKGGQKMINEARQIYEQMSKMQAETGKYQLQVGHYENALSALPYPLRQIASAFGDAGKSISNLSKSDLPAASKAIKASTLLLGTALGTAVLLFKAIKGGIQTIAQFEQANANLATILGVSTSEMEALTLTAQKLGATTRYTASEVTNLQTELAKLGFTQQEILNMQKPVLNFATAVGVTLPEAAKLGGQALRIFGLDATEAERALGVLTVTTNKSAADAAYFENALSTVGPVAKTFGLQIEDVSALLGTLANSGFDASSAATATRNILLNLADTSGKLAVNLGKNVRTFDEMIDALIELRSRGVDLNDTLELTDKRSVAAFNTFLDGAESAKALRNELQNVTGELDRIATERMNTVEGSILSLKSAWEGLVLSMSGSAGTIKSIIDSLTNAVRTFTLAWFPEGQIKAEKVEEYTKKLGEVYKEKGKDFVNDYISYMDKYMNDSYEKMLKEGSRKQIAVAKASLDAWKQSVNVFQSGLNANVSVDTPVSTTGGGIKQPLKKTEDESSKAAKAQVKALEEAKKLIDAELAVQKDGSKKQYELKIASLDKEREIALAKNKTLKEELQQQDESINKVYDLKRQKLIEEQANKEAERRLQIETQNTQRRLELAKEGSEEEANLRIELLDKQRQAEIQKNNQMAEELKRSEAEINSYWNKKILKEYNDSAKERELKAFDLMQEGENTRFQLAHKNQKKRDMFAIEQEIARWEKILQLDEQYGKALTEQEISNIKDTINKLQSDLQERGSQGSQYGIVADMLFKGIESVSGSDITDRQMSALNDAAQISLDNVRELIDAYVELAEARYAAAQAAVDSAQRAYEAELEARNNGYASKVEEARKELELQKEKEAAALEEKKKAQKAQLALDTITQISSLITATAETFSALSGIPIVGPALAAIAVAAMWGTFAAAKIKAAQLANEEYGEGTVELLDGGSHASGNDIDMGVTKDGKRRKAEGGEYFAIINKRNSRKYRDVIPDVINSFNDGSFAKKYQRAGEGMSEYALQAVTVNGETADLSKLERDVRAIREISGDSVSIENGYRVTRHKNLIRRVKL